MARVRRDPEEAKALILDAAEAEFLASGYEAFNTAAVARRAGVSRPLVAHYFGSRDALLQGTLDRALAALAADMFDAISVASEQGEGVDRPSLVLERIHPVLARHAQLLVMTMVSGRAELLDLALLEGMLAAVHGVRQREDPEVRYEDTVFQVATQFFSLLLESVSGGLLGRLLPALGGAEGASAAFRAWILSRFREGLLARPSGAPGEP